MTKVNVLVLAGYGTNCQRETAYAAQQAGADSVRVVHFSELLSGEARLRDFNFLIFPGGFLDGDDLGAAHVAALRWRYATTAQGRPLLDDLKTFFQEGGLILGICNGFQLLVKLGLLPALGLDYFTPQVSLGHNDSARFEDRWVHLGINTHSPCVFTTGLDRMYLPVRHGEGKIVPRDEHILSDLQAQGLVAMTYVHPDSGEPSMEYPHNPNGSPMAIAGLTDPSGRILGLMPHPEAYNHVTNHPAWTRNGQLPLGTVLLTNAVNTLRQGQVGAGPA